MFFRNSYPEKVDPNRIPNIHILARCGIGDMYAFLTRISSLQKKYPKSKIYFYIGGWKEIPFFISEVLAPYHFIDGVFVLEGYYRRSKRRMGRMIRFIKSKALKGDIIENWILPENFLKYPMNLPFAPTVYEEDQLFVNDFFSRHGLTEKNTVAIHPISTKGNADTFEAERFWDSNKWQQMVDILIEKGYKILLLGAKGEDHNIRIDNQNVFNFQGTSIRQTMASLVKVKGILCTSSWTWEVPAYYGLAVTVLWGVRYQHSAVLLPEGRPLKNTYIETNMKTEPRDLCLRFIRLLEECS